MIFQIQLFSACARGLDVSDCPDSSGTGRRAGLALWLQQPLLVTGGYCDLSEAEPVGVLLLRVSHIF